MDNKRINNALNYNKRQGYSKTEIKLIQAAVNALVDGWWGRETVRCVAAWQKSQGLVPDGKVGPHTYSALKADLSSHVSPCNANIGCGLAAYDNNFPGHTPEEAMQLDWNTALGEGCTELRYWSSEWLVDETLPGGGNKGNLYSGPWLQTQTPPPGVILGAWIDDPVRNAKSEVFADRLQAMHIRRASLMINKSNTHISDVPWNLRWKRGDLEAIAKVYSARGIDMVGTCWPRPSKSQIDAMCKDMKWILDVLQSKVFEVDTESNWKPKFLEGFRSMDQAASYLVDAMRKCVGKDGELELTTYTYHTENSAKATLAPYMDRLLPQGYAVRHRGHSVIDWGHQLAPGRHVSLAVNRARQAAAAS